MFFKICKQRSQLLVEIADLTFMWEVLSLSFVFHPFLIREAHKTNMDIVYHFIFVLI